jgi:hypothetical protein
MAIRRATTVASALEAKGMERDEKLENMTAAISLHYMHYDFARVHQTLGTTPAIAAGVTSHRWTLHEIAELPDLLPSN